MIFAAEDISVAIAQMNSVVGDLNGNFARLMRYHEEAISQRADLLICPELALIGYPPEDLVLMPAFRKRAMYMVEELARQTTKGPAILIGCPWEEKGKIYNAAILLDKGKIAGMQFKTMLPNEGIFDEKRLFSPGNGAGIIRWRGVSLGILICEDMWHIEQAAALKKKGAELLIVMNASPYEIGKLEQRKGLAALAVKKAGVPLIYVNAVGGQDDIVFDGGSFIMADDATLARQLKEFSENLEIAVMHKSRKRWQMISSRRHFTLSHEEALYRAMMMGLHDYVNKNGFSGVVLGLSGGIDSAVTAAVAVDALGEKKVRGVLLPSPYSSKDSVTDAKKSAALLGIKTMTVPITPGMDMFEGMLGPIFDQENWMEDVSIGGNVQSRLRGMILMAISNRFGWMLLSTGNKSEIAVGYSTLYGDSCGGYNVLKDIYKTQVYAIAEWRNRQNPVIPQRSITKAPSAELAPGQTDQDQLPPYEILDHILTHHIEERLSADEIIKKGYEPDIVKQVVKMVRMSEYKRRQSCPGVKVSSMLFGRDRRYPLTNKF